jgi:hypothetical protein
MIQGEGRGSAELPTMLFVVMKRLWSLMRMASLMVAAKNGFVENKNHVPIVTAFSAKVDG